jgi:hypothetical protein
MSAALNLAGAVLSIGVAFGLNLSLRPEFAVRYDAAEYTQEAGTLSLSHAGGSLEIPLMAIHIVTTDTSRFGRRHPIRELNLRAAGSGDGEVRVELFADLSRTGGDLLGGTHDPSVLLQAELPLMRQGRLGSRRSYVLLEGTQPSEIVTGTLQLTDVTEVSGGAHPDYRAEGRIEVQVQTAHGVEMVTGKWNGRVVWDAPLTGT